MPRKQRFKPSRKPKPMPPSEDKQIERLTPTTAEENLPIPGRDHRTEGESPSLSGSDASSG